MTEVKLRIREKLYIPGVSFARLMRVSSCHGLETDKEVSSDNDIIRIGSDPAYPASDSEQP